MDLSTPASRTSPARRSAPTSAAATRPCSGCSPPTPRPSPSAWSPAGASATCSAAAGCSWSAWPASPWRRWPAVSRPASAVLIVARVLQGLFGAVMIPQGLALVKVVFPPEQLGKAFIPFGPVMGLAGVAGPILAGWLHRRGPRRHPVAFDLPHQRADRRRGLRAGVALPAPRDRRGPQRPPRPRGVSLLTLASAMLIVPLVQGRELGWPAWTWVLMIGSLVVAGAVRHRPNGAATTRSSSRRCSGSAASSSGWSSWPAFFASLSGFVLAFNLLHAAGPRLDAAALRPVADPVGLGTAVGVVLAGAVLAQKLGRATLQLGLGIALVGMVACGGPSATSAPTSPSW